MMLPTRQLGASDLHVTPIGLGTWSMGGPRQGKHWGAQSDDESLATIRHAVDRGVNWLDTAPIYGHGHMEDVVGRALRALPDADRPYVFTKCGMTWDENDHFALAGRSARPDAIRAEIDGSLSRLGLERVDLYQVHQIPPDADLDEYWGVMLELVDAGKARAVGLSNHPVELLERAEKLGGLTSLQPPLSALTRDAAGDVIPWCHEHDVGVIAYGTLESGLLTGGFDRGRLERTDPDDWRSASWRLATASHLRPRPPRGLSPGPASPAPSSGDGAPTRSTTGSRRRPRRSTTVISTSSRPRSVHRAPDKAPTARRRTDG